MPIKTPPCAAYYFDKSSQPGKKDLENVKESEEQGKYQTQRL
jgi:hypothetical protein